MRRCLKVEVVAHPFQVHLDVPFKSKIIDCAKELGPRCASYK